MSETTRQAATIFLDCRDVYKSYGAVRALRGADLQVAQGSIHGIVGHNGAGKSTLVKVISGEIEPDAGSVVLDGVDITDVSRREAIEHGIGIVPQELTVLPSMTVADNVGIGNEYAVGPFVRRRAMRRRAEETLSTLGLDLEPDVRVEELSPSRQRMVMIAMAVSRECRLLILDEPTASLGVDEAEPLLELITRLSDHGITILYISHRLDEVERLCDRVTVIRDGVAVWTLDRGEFTAQDLVDELVEELPSVERPGRGEALGGEPVVRLRGVHGSTLRGVDLEVRSGAITGFTGLVGSGADEILDIVSGTVEPLAGRVEVGGEPVRFRTPADALRAGIGFVPGTRAEAALTDLTIRENTLASSFEKVAGFAGHLIGRGERQEAEKAVERFGLADRVEDRLANLSGGNQQKIMFSRLLEAGVEVMVINDPTAGVDFRARGDLHELLREVAERGRTVIVRCSEPEEMIDLADEIYVLAGGRVVARFTGEDLSLGALLAASASSGHNGSGPAGTGPERRTR